MPCGIATSLVRYGRHDVWRRIVLNCILRCMRSPDYAALHPGYGPGYLLAFTSFTSVKTTRGARSRV
jgi:hypothetical protein